MSLRTNKPTSRGLAPRLRRTSAVLLSAAVAAGTLALPAAALSPDVVVSEVYGGGGNTGAPFSNDYIELFNRSTTATIDLSGFTVQYASATGAFNSQTALSGSIGPGQYYLVQEASGGAVGAALPEPEATGSINLSATNGKVALVTNGDPATGPADPDVRDFVGYGTANQFEGAGPAPAGSNTTAVIRNMGGQMETDNNAADFAAGDPDPDSTAGGPAPTLIREIQGSEQQSPLVGDTVNNVTGVITAFRDFGFFMQDPMGDSDDATSEGIFVFTGSSSEPTGAPENLDEGDTVQVDGTVVEFRPGGDPNNLTDTQITSSLAGVNETTPAGTIAPTTITLGDGTAEGDNVRKPPTEVIENDTNGDVENEADNDFDPAEDGIDFYESVEGMFVQVIDGTVIGPTQRQGFGEVPVLPSPETNATGRRTRNNGIQISPNDFNPERVIFDDEVLLDNGMMTVANTDTGDTYSLLQGAVGYSFGNFKVQLTQRPTPANTNPPRETTTLVGGAKLTAAEYSLENLSPEEDETTFDGAADQIVNNLQSPDLVALTEVQDSSGDNDTGETDANVTSQRLIAAITARGGPTYQYRDIDPVDGQDGGEPGGNIRVGFLFREDRGLDFIERPGGGPTQNTTVSRGPSGSPQLSSSPGRVEPNNEAFTDSRKPLAGEFTYNGVPLFVIQNHFVSKSEDTPLFGRFQPPRLLSESQRRAQARVVNRFVQQILAVQSDANVIVLGDLNEFEFRPPLADLQAGGILNNLLQREAEDEQYTFVFDGNSQVLDHTLVSDSLNVASTEFDIVHASADYADRRSDHDALVTRLNVPPAAVPAASVANNPSVLESNGGQARLVFNVRLSGPSSRTVTVDFATANGTATAGSDYFARRGTLTFEPGQTSKPVGVMVIGDARREPNETLRLNLSNPSGATIGDGQGTGTIRNDD